MTKHVPVLSKEVLEFLDIDDDDTVLDGTVGAGGHARGICAQLTAAGTLIGIDKDRAAVQQTRDTLASAGCTADVCLQIGDFAHADQLVADCGVSSVSAAMLDLGFRSGQLVSGRGFTFQRDEPLLMTFKAAEDLTEDDLTARQIVNEWSKATLEKILDGYANERYAETIAEAIVQRRAQQPIETTGDLVTVVKSAAGRSHRSGSRHPATQTFQALRMAVNDEVRTLERGLRVLFSLLDTGGRLAVISFHSVEDRIVKQFFATQSGQSGKIITDSPVTPDTEEVGFNPRARSAKLRCLEKTASYSISDS